MLKKNKILLIMFLFCFIFIFHTKALAYEDNQVVDKNKIWTVRFTGEVGFDEDTKNAIVITDKNGKKIDVSIEKDSDPKCVKVLPPKDGYKPGESYTLTIGKKSHSKKNVNMKKDRILHFTIKEAAKDESNKDINNYTIEIDNGFPATEVVIITLPTEIDSSQYDIFLNEKKMKYSNGKFVGSILSKDKTYNEKDIRSLIKINKKDNNKQDNKDNSKTITFKDKNLERVIRDKIKKPTEDIYKNDVEKITELYAPNENIKDISGIENLVNLEDISLDSNSISDITPLKNLIKLTKLHLSSNQINDINSLKNLNKLEELSLTGNQIQDIDSLSSLINLKVLFCVNNQITDINSLNNLVNLKDLYLDKNKIKIITLGGLGNLENLTMTYNCLNNIQSLEKLSNLKTLSLLHNKINDVSALGKLTNLGFLDLRYNSIKDISSLKSLINLKKLYLAHNLIVDYSTVKCYYDKLEDKDFEINDANVDIDESKIRIDKDEVQNITWYQPYNYAGSHMFMYIGQNSSNEIWLRCKFRYMGDNTIWTENYTINVDDQIYTITPKFSDVKKIHNELGWWEEIYDMGANDYYINLFKKIASSKKAMLRVEGVNSYKDFTIREDEKENITNILNKYNKMLGK